MVDSMKDLNIALDEVIDNNIEYNLIEKDTYIFKSTKFHHSFLKNLKELQDIEKFCDIVLKTSKNSIKTIKAHKVILASASGYFRSMFTGGFKEDNNSREIVIEGINFSSLEAIINFIYTSEIVIKETNVQNLLVSAKILQIEDVVNSCCIFLNLNMDATNCIGIEEFAGSMGCQHLAKKAKNYMIEHFSEIISSEEFYNLTNDQLSRLLQRDDLSVRCESIVFKAVIDWVKFDPEKRRRHLDHLFQCVRFHFLPPSYLKEQMKTNEIFRLKEAERSFRHLQEVVDELISHKNCPYIKPRTPMLRFALFVIGGYQRQSISTVECLKISAMTWERCADMKTPRSGVACIALALYIYAIGGRNNSLSGNIDCADVECYDPFTNNWQKKASMTVPRSRAGVGIIDGHIYACGGAQDTTFHSSVERYNPMENRWELMASMNLPRIGLGCAVVNRLLYAVGGYDGQSRLNQVECYNPEQNRWSFVASMKESRSGAGVCAIENFIYAVGGYTTNLQLNSAERYDTLTNQWSYITPMNSPRSALACVTLCSKLFAIGGYNGSEFLSSTEIYDPATNDWTNAPIILSSERSGHGAAITVESKSK